MKAVLHRHVGTLSTEYRSTTLADDAGKLEVEGTQGVISVKKEDGSVLAVAKLGESDYVKLES